MKRTLLIASALVMISTASTMEVNAVTTTPSAAPTTKTSPSPTPDKDVQKIKDIVAKSSELKKSQKATAGYIISTKDNSFVIKTTDGTELEVKIDNDLTSIYQISGTTKKELEKGDLEKNMYVIVRGPVQDKVVSANVIYVDEQYTVVSGKITEVNADDFSVKFITPDKQNYTVDVQSSTQQQIVDIKTLEIARTGFTKLKEGDLVHVVIKKDIANPKTTRFDGIKILVVPQEYFQK